MKVKSAIRVICKHCYVVKRGKTRFVYCKKNPKHKQRQGFHTMACIQKSYDEEFSGLQFGLDNLNLSSSTFPIVAVPSIVNPLDNVSNAIAQKLPIKYHPELGISQIYWNI